MSVRERPPRDVDAVVVGGGFYGAHIAVFLARQRLSVTLLEREPALLSRASYTNQARVHGGYHYPRSILTSLRSRRNYPHFVSDYPGAIDRSFTKLYAIARRQSKVTAAQFAEFCRRIGAPITPAAKTVAARFDTDLVEAVFEVDEMAFDARALAEASGQALEAAEVRLCVGTEARAIESGGTRRLRVRWGDEPSDVTDADWVFLCTYSALNDVLAASSLPTVPLVHEITELALVELPSSLRAFGITVMDGPFWSSMPFPPAGVHSLSHVRYTPHARWNGGGSSEEPTLGAAQLRVPRPTRVLQMLKDAVRYLPAISAARYVRSLWEVKTILPRSEMDDSRPILARNVAGAPGLVTVLGAKIDSVYDVEEAVLTILQRGNSA